MAKPTIQPNEVKVMDCLEYLLGTINNANGYYVDGMVVDRLRDPRKKFLDRPTLYRQKQAMVSLWPWDIKHVSKGSIGGGSTGIINCQQQIHIYAVQTLTIDLDSGATSCDQLRAWMRHDIFQAINSDPNLYTSAATVRQQKTTLNGSDWGNPPSCINLMVNEVKAGPALTFPDVHQTFSLSYSFTESGLTLSPGR